MSGVVINLFGFAGYGKLTMPKRFKRAMTASLSITITSIM